VQFGPPDSPQERARAALADRLRELISLAVSAAVPLDALEEATTVLEAVALRLQDAAGGRTLERPLPDPKGGPEQYFPTSPVIGSVNPLAPPARFFADGQGGVGGTVRFGPAYEGPPGFVHGGFVALLLDELLGAANFAAGEPGMTGTLTVRYVRPTPLGEPLSLFARFDHRSGRRIHTRGVIEAGGQTTAEAHGVFVQVGPERFRHLEHDAGTSAPRRVGSG
jgi:acyl-coenzyme A thioesterase PaaI-like protein